MSKYHGAMRRMALVDSSYTSLGHGAPEHIVWQYDRSTGLVSMTEAEMSEMHDAPPGHNVVWSISEDTVASGRIDPNTSTGSIVFRDGVPRSLQEDALAALLREIGVGVKFLVFPDRSPPVSLPKYFGET